MQNDFLTGSLKNEEGVKIIPAVVDRVKEALDNKDVVIFTKDTHGLEYKDSIEGKKLPIVHCLRYSPGWDICPELKGFAGSNGVFVVEKPTFGANWTNRNLLTASSGYTISDVVKMLALFGKPEDVEIELCGVCTDICVVSNALILKAMFPNNRFIVNSALCAGLTVEKHNAALETMRSCHIDVI